MTEDIPTRDLVKIGIARGWIKPAPVPTPVIEIATRLGRPPGGKRRPWLPPAGTPKDLSKDLRNLL